MRKIAATILSLCTLAVAAFPSLAGFNAPKTARAATQTERHTALADGYAAVSNSTQEGGSTLYLFNERNGGVWQEYLHSQTVTEMHFDGAGNLYFRDETANLYRLNADALDTSLLAEDTSVDCFTFCIDGGYLYSATVEPDKTTLQKTALNDFNDRQTYIFNKSFLKLAYSQTQLYGLEWGSGTGVYALDLATLQMRELFQAPVGSNALAFAGNTAFTTTKSGSLCGYDMTADTPLPEQTGTYTALSAYGNDAYLLSDGIAYRYSATSGALLPADGAFARPLVDKIPTEALRTELSTGAGSFTVVETTDNALLIEVTDEGETYFKHQRSLRKQPLQAIKIAERSGYAVLAYRENPTAAYKTYLVDPNLLTEKTAAILTYDGTRVGYITNAAHLYKYPHLGLPTVKSLERGEQITLVGEVRGLDCDYYEVTFGEERGYIPKAYVTPTDGIPPQAETLTEGETDSDKDGVWRLVYLLLGGAAICILVDFLILRKKPED